ncbi:DUF5719 family protein [Bifidobacterium moukalabense]|uniref:Organic solvents resistance ABC transporter permease n=1 Tax=Bifidobacterium moukalabense DSM 27321 TaxID=1435051 RepID=W4N8H9_9BIFI|nr:DUF5719 family protein [Bifidobacterium moukalabense]ETY71342.1 hypothetical protein BMOU_0830 [Bifidobacterium moukalabense DSM 27321]
MSRHSRTRAGVAMRVVLATVSTLIIVALVVVSLVYRPSWLKADSSAVSRSSVSHTVSPTQLETYCPARMTIADTEAYGDSEYQASNGNVASSVRYTAFGSVFRSSALTLGSDDTSSATTLNKQDADDDDEIFVASGNVDDGAKLQDTRLLTSNDGTGAVSSVMSWATDGDLKGVSAASCMSPALEQSFLVTGTQTGMTQQLVVANPSAKATSLTVKVWGTDSSGALALSTGSTLTVAANGETVMNLAAAASKQDALYVTVSSAETPIAAIIRSIAMDGLTSKGSDYAAANNTASKRLAFGALSEGDTVSLYMFAHQTADLTVSWMDGKGLKQAHRQTIEGNRASVIDLGGVPKGATGLIIDASQPVSASAKVEDDGNDGQADFALVNATGPSHVSALAIPDQASAKLGVMNTSDQEASAVLRCYDADGKRIDERTITLKAGAATMLDLADIDGAVAAASLDDDGGAMVWNGRIGQEDVAKAKMAGLSIISPVDLKETKEQIRANADMTVVR